MPSKPRISPWNGFYRCDGQGVSGFGFTPASAFEQWRVMLHGATPPSVLPTLSPQDVLLLEQLKAWKPEKQQAH